MKTHRHGSGRQPRRVLHIITRMILGGAQENTLLSCEGLNRSDEWDVILLTGPPRGPEGELLQRAVGGGIRTIVLPQLCRELSPRRDLQAFTHILGHIRSLRPHIVHTHSSKAGVLGRLAAYAARTPVVIHTIHGLPFHPYLPRWENTAYIMMEKAAARCSDGIVCVADAMRKQALDAGVGRPGQYRVIYSGMDVEPYLHPGDARRTLRSRLGFGPGDIVVTKIARLFHLKGHEYVLRAAPGIIRDCPSVRFLFVGDGILRSELEQKAEALGVADRVVFTGLLAPSRIPEIIAATDILVHASLREGLPRVAVQAMLGGKPVVCFDLDGAPEVVINGVTGLLAPPRSVDALGKAVTEMARRPGLARKMGEAGRKRVAERFTAEKMTEDLEELYRALDFSAKPG